MSETFLTESQMENQELDRDRKAERVTEVSHTSISNFKALIAETDVNQRLASATQTKKALILRAVKNNSGDIFYGASNIDSDNSDYLSPGEKIILYFADPYNIYIRGTQNDIVYVNALS